MLFQTLEMRNGLRNNFQDPQGVCDVLRDCSALLFIVQKVHTPGRRCSPCAKSQIHTVDYIACCMEGRAFSKSVTAGWGEAGGGHRGWSTRGCSHPFSGLESQVDQHQQSEEEERQVMDLLIVNNS